MMGCWDGGSWDAESHLILSWSKLVSRWFRMRRAECRVLHDARHTSHVALKSATVHEEESIGSKNLGVSQHWQFESQHGSKIQQDSGKFQCHDSPNVLTAASAAGLVSTESTPLVPTKDPSTASSPNGSIPSPHQRRGSQQFRLNGSGWAWCHNHL